MQFATAALLVACTVALGACEREPGEPESIAVSPTPTPTREPVSIIRPDIEVEREPVPLAPLEMRIRFVKGGAALDEEAKAELATALESPQLAAGGKIVLRGHSDSAGSDAANLRASQARAEAVRDWLVENGVAEDRIRVIAMGEQNPIAANALPDGNPNEAGREANRRVELSIEVPSGTPAERPTQESETLVDELAR